MNISKLQTLKYIDFIKYKKKENIKKKKIAIITGGTGRIGSVFLNELIFRNYNVLCLSRSQKKFNLIKLSIPRKLSNKLSWSYLDISNLDSINQTIRIIKKKYNHLDCLINCACSGNRNENFQYDKNSVLNEIIGTFGGTVFLTESIMNLIRKKKFSKIINIGSLWSEKAPNFKIYLKMKIAPSPILSTSKGSILNYTKFLASREGKNYILCNSLSPGWFPKKGLKPKKNYIENIIKNIPHNRIGELTDLICAANFLLSHNNNYFSGQNIIVDGGYSVI